MSSHFIVSIADHVWGLKVAREAPETPRFRRGDSGGRRLDRVAFGSCCFYLKPDYTAAKQRRCRMRKREQSAYHEFVPRPVAQIR